MDILGFLDGLMGAFSSLRRGREIDDSPKSAHKPHPQSASSDQKHQSADTLEKLQQAELVRSQYKDRLFEKER